MNVKQFWPYAVGAFAGLLIAILATVDLPKFDSAETSERQLRSEAEAISEALDAKVDESGGLPETLSKSEHDYVLADGRFLRVDGKEFDVQRHEIAQYDVSENTYTFCLTDKSGAWALYDSNEEFPLVSGRSSPQCQA